ncbi:MAG TPA: CBS domain-containing protein [Usitatibacteraceae bacterium]|jgi:CBS-domain-containing membrane protein|nr:CBS domain-containing protein [Usitatibacteraceae bacterium]HQY47953.1 CBS domain-containing protein [Usitatibacteraceae bacterium]HRA23692.1 CBS domain-containing protein [Usitatibacteraceae bacterium]
MQAKDVMTSPVVTVSPEATVTEVAKLLLGRHISAAPVVDEAGHLLGIVSEGDLMRRPEAGTERHRSWWLTLISDAQDEARDYLKTHGLHARDVMTRNVLTVDEETSLHDIASLLEKERIKRVPVVRDGKVVGIVSRANLLQALVAQSRPVVPPADDRALRQAVMDAIKATGARTLYVNVVVSEGVVHLWGMAHTEEEKNAMCVAAESVTGTRQVCERITLMPRGAGAAT